VYTAGRVEFPPLPEGKYYVTVRGFNNIVRGGPLVTTVCNSVPLAIDRTPPVLNSLLVSYDDINPALSAAYNTTLVFCQKKLLTVRDSMSGIQKIQFGLGRSRFDEDLIPFAEYYNRSFVSFPGPSLPEGKYMYGRIRMVNNGL
jgi:hypothetical protein